MNGYPIEGCAPEPPYVDPFAELAKRDPVVAIAIQQASEVGRSNAENHYVRGEARQLERKLNESEAREAKLADSNRFYQKTNSRLEEYLEESDTTVRKLEKKLAPKAKKVVKTKKGKK